MARPRVTVYFSEEIYKHLAERADREVRTVANLVEYLVVQAVQEDIAQSDRPEPKARD